MKKVMKKTRALFCAVLCLCILMSQMLPVVINAVGESFGVDFAGDEIGAAYGNFNVVEESGRKFIKSAAGGFGATNNLYGGQLGDAIKNGFEISADFMFPAGSEGILWLYMKGMSAANDFQMMDISFIGGVTRVYAQDGPSLGNIDDTSPLGVQVNSDTWHSMKVVKDEALYELYIDDVKVLEYTYANTNNPPTEIYLMQFLTAGDGACYDDLLIKTLPPKTVATESITIISSSSTALAGNSVTVTASVSPANANDYEGIEWYVKAPGESDYSVLQDNDNTITLNMPAIGEYSK